jgi:hypothetical protein
MVEVEADWLRVPGTRGWVGGADLEPDQIVAILLEATRLPMEPAGPVTVSTGRVPNDEILARLTWLQSFELRNAKSQLHEGSRYAVPALAAYTASIAVTFGKELGAKAAASAQMVIEAAGCLWNFLRDRSALSQGDILARDGSQHLLIVSQAETKPLANGSRQQQTRLNIHDGEGLLEWDPEALRWQISSQGRRQTVPNTPELEGRRPQQLRPEEDGDDGRQSPGESAMTRTEEFVHRIMTADRGYSAKAGAG